MNNKHLLLSACMIFGITACKTTTPAPEKAAANRPAAVASPTVYVYKMKADYSRLVPVILDPTRSRIVSYPHPNDLKAGDALRLPTALADGYWLDNKGITPQVAFLKYTYEEYSRLKQAPSMEELMDNIADKNPLTEIHNCGKRSDYKNIVEELNRKIERNELSPVLRLER